MKRTVTEALAAWKLNLPTQLSPDQGLINQTWIVGSSSVEDSNLKLSYDLFYLKNFSSLLDFIILLRTIKTILKAGGR